MTSVLCLRIGCANSHHHKIWVRSCPGKRLLFGIEKTIDHDSVALSCVAAARPSGFAINNVRSAVYCNISASRKTTLLP